MADKIDQLKIGNTFYDIDLPPDATPSIAGLTVDNGNMSQIYVSSHNGLSALTLGTDGLQDNGSNQLDIWVTSGLKFEQSKQDSGGLHVYTWTFPEQGGTVALTDNIAITNSAVSTTGSGNAVTGVSISNGQIVASKGETFVVTSNTNQDINGVKTFLSRPRSAEAYTKLKHIASTAASGFPYIRTGVLRGIHYSTKLTCILEGYFNSSQTYGFCGYDSGGQFGQKSGKWSTETDGLGTTNVNCIGETNKATVKQVLDFSNSTNKLYIGSTMVAGRNISNTTFSQQADYPIFVAYNGTYTYNPGKLVLSAFKMYDGDDSTGTLIRDFIPVKNSNNEIGLLDLVENKFYRNQGTISFDAGDEDGTIQVAGELLTTSDLKTVAFTGSYNDLDNTPSISNATITIKQTGISDQTFTLNGSAKTITLTNLQLGSTSTTAAAGNHVHTFTPSGTVSLTNTNSSGTTYVESISNTAASGSPTTRHLSASPSHTSTNTGANNGSAVAAYTSVSTAGSISATRTTSGSGTNARRKLTISHTDPSFGTTNAAPHTHTHTYDKTTGITLTANTSTGTGTVQYLQSYSVSGGTTTATTKHMNASFSGTEGNTGTPS